MIELYQLPPMWGLPNISPASMKLETWLRMAGLPYEVRPADPAQAPKGKFPYVRHDGVLVGDSTLIIERLKKSYGVDPDEGLTKAERGVSLAYRRLAKENLVWVIVHTRWADEANWPTYKEMLFSKLLPPGLPQEVQDQISGGMRKGMLDQLHGHGMGRHTPEEIRSFGMADLTAISDFLGDKPFFFGERPTTVDATLSAYVSNVLECPLLDPVKDYGLGLPNLSAYTKRVRSRYFPSMSST